jgi:malate synthase
MMINALNSGARVFMADFEDANSPTWENMVQGQVNVIDAIERTIEFDNGEGRVYRLNDRVATLLVRPRGWHMHEWHFLVDGEVVSASLFDFGLFIYHNGARLLEKGSGPYLYLPKLESHLEARLWNDIFTFAEGTLGLPAGSIKATVLIETIPAAFEMEEILYELRDHSGGLNAGRWDYIFSFIKRNRLRPEFLLPDRAAVTMSVPFMRAYSQLLVKTAHRRGAFAIGGMAAFVPNRRDPEVTANALAKVREDKVREANDGFDGTWVAHPDLVSVATEVFDGILGERLNQLDRQRDDVHVEARDLLDARSAGGAITEAGLRTNVRVGIQYLESWLRGNGAVAIDNLMEDAATSEISRAQVWQWLHHGASLREGPTVTRDLVLRVAREELEGLRSSLGHEAFNRGLFGDAADLFAEVALGDDFVEFLTLPAYSTLVRLEDQSLRRAA